MTPSPPSPAPARRETGFLLLLALVPALLAGWLHPQRLSWAWDRPAAPEVTVKEIAGWTASVLWVDARPTAAYAQKHIPAAILCNEDAWEEHLPALLAAWQPGMRVVVYCDGQACAASQAVAMRLHRELELPDLYVLQGGWTAWQQSHP